MNGAVVDESLVATAARADRQVAIWTTFANGVCLKALDEDQHRVSTETTVLVLVEKDHVAAGTNVDVHLLTIGVFHPERFHLGEAVGAGEVVGESIVKLKRDDSSGQALSEHEHRDEHDHPNDIQEVPVLRVV